MTYMKREQTLLLSERDINILMFIHFYNGCTVEHLRRRFFRTVWGRSACYARIRRLCEAQYLESKRLPSMSGVGSGKAFLTIGALGRSVVSDALSIPLADVDRSSRAL